MLNPNLLLKMCMGLTNPTCRSMGLLSSADKRRLYAPIYHEGGDNLCLYALGPVRFLNAIFDFEHSVRCKKFVFQKSPLHSFILVCSTNNPVPNLDAELRGIALIDGCEYSVGFTAQFSRFNAISNRFSNRTYLALTLNSIFSQ